eukprot:scaffold445517_cov29-Prasinocladus_malaysianus.AAC.1
MLLVDAGLPALRPDACRRWVVTPGGQTLLPPSVESGGVRWGRMRSRAAGTRWAGPALPGLMHRFGGSRRQPMP